MKAFIFSTASYLITVNFDQELNSSFSDLARDQKVKNFSSSDSGKILQALS